MEDDRIAYANIIIGCFVVAVAATLTGLIFGMPTQMTKPALALPVSGASSLLLTGTYKSQPSV